MFVDYARRMTDRDAYRRAKDIDCELIAEAAGCQQRRSLATRLDCFADAE